jgi:hypothetical protein
MLVVVAPPGRDSNPRLRQAGKPVIVQTLVTKAPIETLDIGILHRLSCLDQLELNTVLVNSLIQRLASGIQPARRFRIAKMSRGIYNCPVKGRFDLRLPRIGRG